MTIWTIYNHGTGGSSLKGPDKAEIVNLFGNNDRRPQFKGKLITEGVGSIRTKSYLNSSATKVLAFIPSARRRRARPVR